MIDNRIWADVTAGELSEMPVCGGRAFGYSQRSPEKETPNEDAAGLFVISDSCAVFCVADGVGGAAAGDRAARHLVESLQTKLESASEPDSLRSAVLDGIESANEEILGWGIGAAATLAVVIYANGSIRPMHIGDAMVLLCGNRGKLKYTTVAHGPVAMAMELGILDEAEAMAHEDRNIITNCVGSREMRIEIGPQIDMQKRDTLMVSSDGLFDNLREREIIDLIRAGKLQEQLAKLVALTADRMHGGDVSQPCKPDDATLVCFRRS